MQKAAQDVAKRRANSLKRANRKRKEEEAKRKAATVAAKSVATAKMQKAAQDVAKKRASDAANKTKKALSTGASKATTAAKAAIKKAGGPMVVIGFVLGPLLGAIATAIIPNVMPGVTGKILAAFIGMIGFIVGFILKDAKLCDGKAPILNKVAGGAAAGAVSTIFLVLLKYLIPSSVGIIHNSFNSKIGIVILTFICNLIGSGLSSLISSLNKEYCEKSGMVQYISLGLGVASILVKAFLIMMPFNVQSDEVIEEVIEEVVEEE